jgi:hypothetical protein
MAKSGKGGPTAGPVKRAGKRVVRPARKAAASRPTPTVAPEPLEAAAPVPAPIAAAPVPAPIAAAPRGFRAALRTVDRMAVLIIGMMVGAVIYASFGTHAKARTTSVAPAPIVALKAAGGQSPFPAAADCAMPFYPRLLKTVAKGDPISVGVFGDSFGEGIWAALYWKLPKKDHYQVFKFAERATGFTRYQSANLEEKAAAAIASQPVDIAVISFGANDTQGIYDNGHVYPLLSPNWKVAYGRRVARYVGLLRAQGAMVYWVGLPKMRSPEFDGQIAAMNDFYSIEMAALDVPFLPTGALSVDGKGEYSIRLPDPKTKKDVIMRADDGIHMTIPGYERITEPLVGRIKAYVASSRDMAKAAATEQVASAGERSL